MNKTTDIANKAEEAVEKSLSNMLRPARPSIAPPDQRSIRELIEEIEGAIRQVNNRVDSLKARLDHFYRLQNEFYVGDKL